MNLRPVLQQVVEGRDLPEDQAQSTMEAILHGQAEDAWIAGFLVALRMKGESAGELAGFARAMRGHATPVKCQSRNLVDTCGTGGDGSGSFNISTAAAFVAAGAGARVAKHGNRSVSSRCGSADVLEALGARLDLDADAVARCIDTVGFGFLFAPAFHKAMRHAVAPRRALAMPTAFNLLGPLTNPAAAQHQLLGVFRPDLVGLLSEVLLRLGGGPSILVHGHEGLDELSVCGPSTMAMIGDGIELRTIEPEELGLTRHSSSSLDGGDAQENARLLRQVLHGEGGARRDVVALNAAAALLASGKVPSLEQGLESASRSIDEGRGLQLLEAFIDFTQDHGGAP